MNFDLVHVVRSTTILHDKRWSTPLSIESRARGYQVYKGILEANSGEELPYRHGSGEVRASLFSFNIASAFFDISIKGGL